MEIFEKVTNRHGPRVMEVDVPVDWEKKKTGGLVIRFRGEERKSTGKIGHKAGLQVVMGSSADLIWSW